MNNLKLNDVEMEEIRKALTVRKEDLECKAQEFKNDKGDLSWSDAEHHVFTKYIIGDLCTVKKVEKKLATLMRKRKLGLGV